MKLISHGSKVCDENSSETERVISSLLLCAFPDRIAGLRQEGEGRFLLSQGRGVRLAPASRLIKSRFIVAANVDAGTRTEGLVRLAVSVEEETIRQECALRIETLRRVQWDHREKRISAAG